MPWGAVSGPRGARSSMSASARPPDPGVDGPMNRAGRDSFVPRRVSDLASRQDGLITTEQLHLLGVDGDQILRWHRTGWLHVRPLNVFSVGHRASTPRGGRLAAVLAAGDGAALSHV